MKPLCNPLVMPILLVWLVFGVPFFVAATPMVFGGHTYDLIVPESIKWWTAAKADAESRGGHLVTITSEAEWNFIVGAFHAQNHWGLSSFVGLHDSNEEGKFEWVTGESYDDSLSFLPPWGNAAFANYGQIYDEVTHFSILMSSDLNVGVGDYIIEFDSAEPIPEPSTFALFGLGILAVVGFSYRRFRINRRLFTG